MPPMLSLGQATLYTVGFSKDGYRFAVNAEVNLQEAVFNWLDQVVIGMNFCPFARSVRQRNRINLLISPSEEPAGVLEALSDAATKLLEEHVDDTVLFLLPTGFEDFDDFLDLVAVAEALFVDLGLEGQLQIASFHPDYCFADVDDEHVGNWTNRSPVPILHLLQEASVGESIQRYPDVELISDRNIDLLESMATEDLDKLKHCCVDTSFRGRDD